MAPKKNQKMSLGDFLGDQSLGSWADEMEDMPVASESRTGYGGERRAFTAPGMGERSFSNRGFAVREQLPLPNKPPYTAHLGNLSFDATEGDVHDFFQDCGVAHVRIVEDKMEHKPKGFGYVEFSSLDGLKKALEKDGTQFQGRNIRLSVADPPKDRPEARELNDWTRKGPLPDLPNQQRRPSERGFHRGYEAAPASDTGSDRGGRRQAPFNDDGKSRDFGNWERKGPLPPISPPAGGPPPREGGRVRSHEGQTPRERKLSPAWGEGTNRSQDGSRPPRKEFQDRPPQPERAPTAAEMDNQWRARMRPDAPQKSTTPTPEPSAPSSPAQTAAPAMRPKLNLQKRTVSEAEPSPVAGGSDSKASPFGAARPIDTAAREREIEEKRQVAVRTKKEADDKAREERKAKAEKEKAEKLAAGKDGATSPIEQNGKADAKENGEDKAPSRSYEILRRVTDDNGENGAGEDEEEDGEDAPANGNIVEDKAVKPKEVVRDPPRGPSGSWRKGSTPNAAAAAAAASSGPATEKLEEEGWNTVPARSGKSRGRGGNQGARALAS